MFNGLKELIRQVISKMFNRSTLEKELETDIVTSDKMANAINLWSQMYEDKAPWLCSTVSSMNLAATIASEYARLTTLELESEVQGNDYINNQYQTVIDNIRIYTEYACAKGGLVFKPYVNGENIEVDLTQADCFFPTAFNSRGEVTGAVFVDTKTIGEKLYTRLEYHNLTTEGYYISNKAYVTRNIEGNNSLGKEIPLTDVSDWEELEPEVMIQNVDKPLFAYFKMPIANTIDTTSPIGVSVFSRATNDIKEADKQYSRILWEYEGSELAVDASIDCFKKDDRGNFVLPKGKERLFRTMEYEAINTKSAFTTFSPEIRDDSLFNGLNNILKQIEFKCGLAYGTISDPQQVDKTAEEIKMSKQRSYQSITDTQKALQKALEHLVYCMSIIGQLSGLPTGGKYEVGFKRDDSILIDAEKERIQDRQDIAIGVMSLVEYRAKWYGETEEEAIGKIPQQADVDTGGDE
ncbi:phage portal protein, putative, A118 family [Anaerosporobacter mobilis DSM 15930]|jgi:A118 family predicted phage portal protein|uniref:Phage portal protein, putative, A118 family n=1 Tax=Anaerosporobacter mobilis DSM 15930 TaxID=1120996 RepID=A0A1M7NIZ0_9FIRM|nr:phage portal protein [Anaerosporobacter mobilis]SHN03758.1 phage portal protein, putative, A118 family [Anaerosporobacter mobilis DSM 15930]